MKNADRVRGAGQDGREELEVLVERGRRLHSRALFEAIAWGVRPLGKILGRPAGPPVGADRGRPLET